MTDWNKDSLANLRTILATLYPTIKDSRRIVVDAGLDQSRIEFSEKAISNWFAILQYANNRAMVNSVIEKALEEYPENDDLKRAKNFEPPAPIDGPKTAQWKGPDRAGALEKLMGTRSTLVPVSYLQIGLEKARSVVRVKRSDGSSGTGFITDNDFLVTNHHVIPDQAAASGSVIQCNYQLTADGLNAPIDQYNLLTDTLRTSQQDDWTVVRIAGNPSATWGSLSLRSPQIQVGDYVNIIQHPGGGPKQVSIAANVIVYLGGGRVQYLTDTLPGSSGSPVFDSQWNVIALHHSGGWLEEPNAPSKTTYYRNEGIAISLIGN